MADIIPIRAGLDADGKFIYSKELGANDKLDSTKISYDTIGNNYLIHDNVNDNLDVIESTLDAWSSAKTLTSFEAFLDIPINVYPCDVGIQIPFDDITRDTDSGWDDINHKYVVQTTGYYQIESAIKLDLGPTYARYNLAFVNRIFIDGVLAVQGKRQTQLKYQNTITHSRYDQGKPIADVFSLEYLTAGQEISISVIRYEINSSTWVPESNCVDEPVIYTTNDTWTYHNAHQNNFLSINMVYAE